MCLERDEASLRVRDQPDLQASRAQAAQYLGHLVVEMEVAASGPLRVDLLRGALDAGTRSAHLLDDAPRVFDEDSGIIRAPVDRERRRGGRDRGLEARGIDRHLVAGAEVAIARALERGPRIDEGEVDVEEDRPCDGPSGHAQAPPSAGVGPATASAARVGTSSSDAAAATSSAVTSRRCCASRRS